MTTREEEMFILGGRAVLIASEKTSVFGFVCFAIDFLGIVPF